MKYIIIILPYSDEHDDVVEAQLCTRRCFATKQEAYDHIKFYAPPWRDLALVVECPKGVEFYSAE